MLRTVLRGRLGFRGMVVTDDMEMEGVLNGTPDVAVAPTLQGVSRRWGGLRRAPGRRARPFAPGPSRRRESL